MDLHKQDLMNWVDEIHRWFEYHRVSHGECSVISGGKDQNNVTKTEIQQMRWLYESQ